MVTIMAKVILTDGREIAVKPKNGTDFSLEELQEVVGGYIEIIYVKGNDIMVLNEEGKLIGLPINDKVSELAGELIVGNVLVCDTKMVK